MSVGEYIRKFEDINWFTRRHMVETKILKVDQFLEGLRPKLSRDVQMAGIKGITLASIVDRALTIEQKIMWTREFFKDIF